MSEKFKSERWDIDRLINSSKDVTALVLLWEGRANDIMDKAIGRDYTEAELAKIETYRKCAEEFRKAMKVIK